MVPLTEFKLSGSTHWELNALDSIGPTRAIHVQYTCNTRGIGLTPTFLGACKEAG